MHPRNEITRSQIQSFIRETESDLKSCHSCGYPAEHIFVFAQKLNADATAIFGIALCDKCAEVSAERMTKTINRLIEETRDGTGNVPIISPDGSCKSQALVCGKPVFLN